MAERTENTRINVYINTAGAVPALKELNTDFKKLQTEQKKLAEGSDEWKKVQKELDSTSKKMVDYTKTVDKTKMSTKQLREYSSQLKKMRDDLVPGTQAWKALDKEITSTSKAMRGANEGTGIFSKGMSALGNVIKVNPLLLLAGVLMAIVAAFKQNDTVMRIFERATKAIGTVVGLFIDKVVMLGSKLVAAFQNPKQAMTDLYEFVKQNLINRFKAFGVILEGIVNLDFKKIANGVLQAGSGVEDVIGKVGKMGDEFSEAAKKQDEITQGMQRLRDEERKLMVLNAERQGQVDVLMAQSMDLNMSIEDRQKALEKAEKIELQMAADNIKHGEEKVKLIKAENALSSSNEEARQREADAERDLNALKAANQLKLQQIKNKSSKLDKKENKEAEAAEKAREKALEERLKLEEQFSDTLEKLREDERRRFMTDQERELDDIRLKYKKIKELAVKVGQDTAEIDELFRKDKEAAEKRLTERNQARANEELRKNELRRKDAKQREIVQIQAHYEELMNLEGLNDEQRKALHDALIEAKKEIDQKYQESAMERFAAFYQTASAALGEFAAIQRNIAERELQQDKRANDEKRKNLDKRLKAGTLSQEQHQKEVEQMELAFDNKRKQIQLQNFRREQAMRLADAIANTAVAVTAAMAKPAVPPFPSAIAAGVLGGLQIAKIASTPTPEMEEGGRLTQGVTHDHPSGGMPIIDPRNGQVLAKVRVGETIVPDDTTDANKPLIDLMLANKGKTITPDMLMSAGALPKVNIAAVSNAVKMEKGGFIDRPSVRLAGSSSSPVEGQAISLTELVNEMRQVRSAIENLKLTVPLTELEEVMETRKQIEIDNKIG
jgi:hypothetical protein